MGATLYVSHDNGMLSPLTEPFGFDVLARSQRAQASRVILDGLAGQPEFTTHDEFHLQLAPTHASVLGREDDGNPVFTQAGYGQGTIYFLSFPIEKELATTPGSFHTASAQPCWQLYEHLARAATGKRVARKDHPMVGITEHAINDEQRVVVLINYSPEPVIINLALLTGWSVTSAWHGALPLPAAPGWQCQLGKNDGLILLVKRMS